MLLGLFTLLVVAGAFGANFNLVLPIFTRVVLHANADALGYLFAAQGVGSLIGALTMTAVGPFLLEPRRIVFGALLFAAMELAFLITPGFTQAFLLLIGSGLVAYAAIDREPGPGYLGVAVLGAFTLLAGAPVAARGSLIGWPLFLLVIGGAGIAIGLRPRRPLPPSPDANISAPASSVPLHPQRPQ